MTVAKDVAEDRMELFRATCREEGITATPQRMAIFREIATSDEHPDADTIRKRLLPTMPHLSFDTVYRTIALFEALGLIKRVEVLCDHARFDANISHHHHFVCIQCGFLYDFESEEIDRYSVPRDVNRIGTVASNHLQLRGVCKACQKKAKNTGTKK